MSQVTRRQFMASAAALGAVPVWAATHSSRSQVASNSQERRDLFPEGVASGDPQPDSVLLWTRRPLDGSGPGKLCMAMSIDKSLNGADLLANTIWIEDRDFETGLILTSPRVGVDYAGEYKDKPWRFFVEGNPHVSRVRFK